MILVNVISPFCKRRLFYRSARRVAEWTIEINYSRVPMIFTKSYSALHYKGINNDFMCHTNQFVLFQYKKNIFL